jgi:hypothetical protein
MLLPVGSLLIPILMTWVAKTRKINTKYFAVVIFSSIPPSDIATMPSCRLSNFFFSLYSRYMFANKR